MACVLVGMHLFWIYFILEFAYKKVKKGNVENTHEAATPAKKGTWSLLIIFISLTFRLYFQCALLEFAKELVLCQRSCPIFISMSENAITAEMQAQSIALFISPHFTPFWFA